MFRWGILLLLFGIPETWPGKTAGTHGNSYANNRRGDRMCVRRDQHEYRLGNESSTRE